MTDVPAIVDISEETWRNKLQQLTVANNKMWKKVTLRKDKTISPTVITRHRDAFNEMKGILSELGVDMDSRIFVNNNQVMCYLALNVTGDENVYLYKVPQSSHRIGVHNGIARFLSALASTSQYNPLRTKVVSKELLVDKGYERSAPTPDNPPDGTGWSDVRGFWTDTAPTTNKTYLELSKEDIYRQVSDGETQGGVEKKRARIQDGSDSDIEVVAVNSANVERPTQAGGSRQPTAETRPDIEMTDIPPLPPSTVPQDNPMTLNNIANSLDSRIEQAMDAVQIPQSLPAITSALTAPVDDGYQGAMVQYIGPMMQAQTAPVNYDLSRSRDYLPQNQPQMTPTRVTIPRPSRTEAVPISQTTERAVALPIPTDGVIPPAPSVYSRPAVPSHVPSQSAESASHSYLVASESYAMATNAVKESQQLRTEMSTLATAVGSIDATLEDLMEKGAINYEETSAVVKDVYSALQSVANTGTQMTPEVVNGIVTEALSNVNIAVSQNADNGKDMGSFQPLTGTYTGNDNPQQPPPMGPNDPAGPQNKLGNPVPPVPIRSSTDALLARVVQLLTIENQDKLNKMNKSSTESDMRRRDAVPTQGPKAQIRLPSAPKIRVVNLM